MEVSWPNGKRSAELDSGNFDVLHVVEIPAGETISLAVSGRGKAARQLVQRYNIREQKEEIKPVFDITVEYDTLCLH